MTITLKLKPEIDAGLLAQAKASGMTLEEFLQSLVEAFVVSGKQTMTSEERASAFESLVAVMRVYGVDQLLAFNVDDFRRYGNLSVVHQTDPLPSFPRAL